jgi:hypothetical protein
VFKSRFVTSLMITGFMLSFSPPVVARENPLYEWAKSPIGVEWVYADCSGDYTQKPVLGKDVVLFISKEILEEVHVFSTTVNSIKIWRRYKNPYVHFGGARITELPQGGGWLIRIKVDKEVPADATTMNLQVVGIGTSDSNFYAITNTYPHSGRLLEVKHENWRSEPHYTTYLGSCLN